LFFAVTFMTGKLCEGDHPVASNTELLSGSKLLYSRFQMGTSVTESTGTN